MRATPRSPPARASASPRAPAPSACAWIRANARRRPRTGAPGSQPATVLDQVQPEQRLGEGPRHELPALALVERPRPRGPVRRVEPDRLIAATLRLLEPEPEQARRQSAAPPVRAHEEHPQVRAAFDPHVRTV